LGDVDDGEEERETEREERDRSGDEAGYEIALGEPAVHAALFISQPIVVGLGR